MSPDAATGRGWSPRGALAGEGPLYALLVLFGLNAVDELDRSGFALLVPEIADHFGLNVTEILAVIGGVAAASLVLQIPVARYADRGNRVIIACAGAVAWACFSFLTGVATSIALVLVARAGSSVGKAVNDPTHNTMLADWFTPSDRPRAFAVHRSANVFGASLGPLLAGLLAFWWGWRAPFLIFAAPTLVLVVLALRLKDPVRGLQERRMFGASEEVAATAEEPAGLGEAFRTIWHIRSVRRLYLSLPFVGVSLLGFVIFASLLYSEVFGLDERARGFLAAAAEPFTGVGLLLSAVVLPRLFRRGVPDVLRFAAAAAAVKSLLAAVFALAPNPFVAASMVALINFVDGVVGPALLFVFSLAIPPRSRATGYAMASLFVLPGLALLPAIGWLADTYGVRAGMVLMTPLFLVGAYVLWSTAPIVPGDIANVWQSTTARSHVLARRRSGEAPLLVCRGVEVSYDDVQVLFGVDIEVADGSVVALLGTNGAGKSTLLRAIAGTLPNQRGAIVYDGVDISYASPQSIAARGVVLLPGGAGVFPHLTVDENLRTASWMHTSDPGLAERRRRALTLFPVLADRLDEPAGRLSGGQQQMLALAMVMLAEPRLLLLDELSVGLAPSVVSDLLEAVRAIVASGTTVVIVEQSLSVAREVADFAYFLERGRVAFGGFTVELLDRPDLLGAVFLDQAVQARQHGDGPVPGLVDGPAPVDAGRPGGEAQHVEPEMTSAASPAGAPGSRPAGPDPGAAGTRLASVDLIKSFGGNIAVDGVSLEFGPGIIGMLGPNGAGKTTLLNLLSGTLAPDSGRILLDGHDVTRMGSAARARIGLTRSFQHSRLFPELTTEEALAIAGDRWSSHRSLLAQALRLPGQVDSEYRLRLRTADLIEMFSLAPVAGKLVGELSTGLRRMVDLACAVAHRPRVLLLDEPTAGISAGETEALAPMLSRLQTELDMALVVVEHDLAVLEAMCHRVVALDSGRVVAMGSLAEVLADPVVVDAYL